jgi:RNA polymerase sigma-70 factor (ECF subfamily)
MSQSATERDLLELAARGQEAALGDLLALHRARLLRTIELRLDRRVRGRIDASDVIQDTCIEASQRIGEFCRTADVPFFVWLRFLAVQKLGQIHRRELGAQARDARREISLDRGGLPDGSSAVLAAELAGKLTGPSEAARREERKLRLQEALDRLREDDREVLALRHFEHLSNSEIADVLALSDSAACRRYVRALQRLKTELAAISGDDSDWEP